VTLSGPWTWSRTGAPTGASSEMPCSPISGQPSCSSPRRRPSQLRPDPKAVQLAVLVLSLVLAAVFSGSRPRSWASSGTRGAVRSRTAVVRSVETGYDKVLESVMTDARGRYAFLVGRNSY